MAAANDADALRTLMRDSVVNGGLYFDDAGCAREFGVAGEVESERLDAFARCLAGLRLQASARQSRFGDVVILQYPPGFELEARVVPRRPRPQLTWIGFASRRAGDLDVPTITHGVLETLRLAGDRTGPLDPAVAAGLELDTLEATRVAYSWIKVCLDRTGKITKAEPYETTSSKASEAFANAAAAWSFRPFNTRGQPLAVCSMVRIAYPPAMAPPVETLPMPPPPSRSKKRPLNIVPGSKLLEGKRTAGNKFIVPDDLTKVEIADTGLTKIRGTYRVCLDETGRVESVLPMEVTGFPAYDAKIMQVIRTTWVYRPYMVGDQPVPVCTAVTFIYSQSGRGRRVRR